MQREGDILLDSSPWPLISPNPSDSLWKSDHITVLLKVISKSFMCFGDQIKLPDSDYDSHSPALYLSSHPGRFCKLPYTELLLMPGTCDASLLRFVAELAKFSQYLFHLFLGTKILLLPGHMVT